jgi:type I restriction enzyme R subunit
MPEFRLSDFRNSFHPRVAVTVDMIATGTDVKPLECLLFMRDVRSSGYFEQMKGRGVRVIDLAKLKSVTPDATGKTHFVIVDAVGVCEHCKSDTKPLDRKPGASFEKVMTMVGTGVVDADLASTLAARLARLDRLLRPAEKKEIAEVAGGVDLQVLVRQLLQSIDADL